MTPVARFGAGHRKTFFFPTDFSGDPRAAPVHLRAIRHCNVAAAAQRAGRQLGTGGHTTWSCRCGACAPGMGAWTGGVPSKVAAKRVLHSHTEQAPPPPVPALGGSSSERNRSTQGSRTDELCDEAERLVVPTSAGLAREHAKPLRSSPKELGVGSALAAFGDGQGSTVPGG